MVQVGVYLQALCIRFLASFQTNTEYFNSERRQEGIMKEISGFHRSLGFLPSLNTVPWTFTRMFGRI